MKMLASAISAFHSVDLLDKKRTSINEDLIFATEFVGNEREKRWKGEAADLIEHISG